MSPLLLIAGAAALLFVVAKKGEPQQKAPPPPPPVPPDCQGLDAGLSAAQCLEIRTAVAGSDIVLLGQLQLRYLRYPIAHKLLADRAAAILGPAPPPPPPPPPAPPPHTPQTIVANYTANRYTVLMAPGDTLSVDMTGNGDGWIMGVNGPVGVLNEALSAPPVFVYLAVMAGRTAIDGHISVLGQQTGTYHLDVVVDPNTPKPRLVPPP